MTMAFTHTCFRVFSHPDHPNLKLLGFRVFYPPHPPIKRGRFVVEACAGRPWNKKLGKITKMV